MQVLSELLTDPQLSDAARQTLEAIPGGASEAALRQGLKTVKGPLLVGVINSIMARGERWGWAELMSLLRDPDPEVVKAAALASGRIAKPLPIKVMQDTMKRSKEPATRSAMAGGLLAAGDTLCKRRQFKEAVPIYLELLKDKDSETVKAARSALAGLPRTAIDEQVRKALDTPQK